MFKRIREKLFYRGGIFHPTKGIVLDWEKDLEVAIKENKKIINIGAGQHHRKGTISVDPAYKKQDRWHIKAWGENLPFEDNSVDFALCNATLEHTQEPAKIVKEIWRVLKPGGRMFVDVPFLFPFHSAPSDYNRMTLNGIEYLCRDFKKMQSGMNLGPNSAIARILVEYIQIFFKNKLLKKIAKNLMKIIVFPLKYFDIFLADNEEATKVAGAVYFYGEK